MPRVAARTAVDCSGFWRMAWLSVVPGMLSVRHERQNHLDSMFVERRVMARAWRGSQGAGVAGGAELESAA